MATEDIYFGGNIVNLHHFQIIWAKILTILKITDTDAPTSNLSKKFNIFL